MQNIKVNSASNQMGWNKYLSLFIILVILAMVGLYANNVYKAFQSASLPERTITAISQAALEQTYGLRVSLVAVTAAGGLVDLRLKIMDGVKAKALLEDKKNFPVLTLENGVTLRPNGDVTEQEIQYDNGAQLVVLYVNSSSVVKPGAPITVMFGDMALESIIAK